jgi:2'-5' RNA ligase
MPIRSFIALELSDEVRANLTQLLTALRQMPAPVKWVEAENLHLTLKFLGEVPEGQIAAITETLSAIAQATPTFAFAVKGVGGFPDLRRPRVLWVGVEAPKELLTLQRQIEQGMERLGFAPKGVPITPTSPSGASKRCKGSPPSLPSSKSTPTLFSAR